MSVNYDNYRFELWNENDNGKIKGAYVLFNDLKTTDVVNSFAAQVTFGEGNACTPSAVTNALNHYDNILSDFKRIQYANLPIGGLTGADRIAYLRTIAAGSNPASSVRTNPMSKTTNIATVALIGGLGITSILAYYFVGKKNL